MFSFQSLKQRHRDERDGYSQALSIRVHRALSWLDKASCCEDDDAKFTFLWIAFNSAYAQDYEFKMMINHGESGLYQHFLSKLVDIDQDKTLYQFVWQSYSGSIRQVLNSEFILKEYWDFHAGRITEAEWKTVKEKSISAANAALSNSDTVTVLSVVFSRLYTLRNQIIHGGATYNSSANRKQLRDCTQILENIVPVIISLMMDGKNELWGDPVYPLVKS